MVIFIFIRPVKCQRWTETVRRKSQSKLSHAGIFEIPENEGPTSSGCWSHFHRNRCCFMKPWIDRRGDLLNTEHSYFRVNLVRYEWHPLLRVCKIALQEILGWPSRSKSSRIHPCRIRKLFNPFKIHINISILMEKATTKMNPWLCCQKRKRIDKNRLGNKILFYLPDKFYWLRRSELPSFTRWRKFRNHFVFRPTVLTRSR